MITFFRSFIKSKVGAAIALIVLGLIAFAFVSGDLSGIRGNGAVDGGSSVASVGSESISATELSRSATNALSRVQQQNPTATMAQLIAQGGVENILDDLVGRTALYVFGRDHGVVAGDRLVDSEIAKIQAFQGVDGKFDQDTFRQAIAQQGLSEKSLRADIAQGLVAQQLVTPAQYAAVMPKFIAKRYASLLNETRSGSVVAFPSVLFAPKEEPKDSVIAAFYKAHTNRFIRPERRVLRYATFSVDEMPAVAAPTDAEIADQFKANAARYAAKDDRKITQVIVPSEADAKAIVAAVDGGKSLEDAAKQKGLSAAQLEFFSRTALTTQYSKAVADAVFAAPVGKLAAPQKSALGWHVIRVVEEDKAPARQLADVREELVKEVAANKQRKAFAERLEKIEDQFGAGTSLPEVAKAMNLEVKTTGPITADGRVYQKAGETIDQSLNALLSTAFKMDQEQPQLSQVGQGQDFSANRPFVIYDVTEIQPSAPAPLNEIKDDVKQEWVFEEGSKAAKAAAIKMQAAMAKGESLEKAMAAVGKPLPPVEQVGMTRATLTRALQSGRQVPPPVSLMFHMTEGSVKVQSAAQQRGWFVVQLKKIDAGKVESDELVEATRKELGNALGAEYAQGLAGAITKQVKVKKNEAAIKAVRGQLAGSSAPAGS